MDTLLNILEQETNGKTYKSSRFCFDTEIRIPTLSYDDKVIGFTVFKDRYGETDKTLVTTKDLSKKAIQIQKETKPLFSYFLDGSRRIYKIDDIEFNRRIYPIVGGQIMVACCKRVSSMEFKTQTYRKELLFSIPKIATSDEKNDEALFLNRLLRMINSTDRLKRLGVEFSKILTYATLTNQSERQEYMDKGQATIQDRMIECEKEVVNELVKQNLLNQDNYLMKDGSLQYSTTKKGDFKDLAKYKSNFRRVVGISKTFNPEFSKNIKGQSNAAVVANLPLYHRSPAIMYGAGGADEKSRFGNVTFSVWYVRIRERKYTDSPFAGILKIEKVLVTDDENENGLSTDEIDLITANIINERNPVCYGKDQRWANHLYPIYLTESYLKSQFISDHFYLNLF